MHIENVPSDTINILNAYLKHSIRYNKYIICIFKAFHHMTNVFMTPGIPKLVHTSIPTRNSIMLFVVSLSHQTRMNVLRTLPLTYVCIVLFCAQLGVKSIWMHCSIHRLTQIRNYLSMVWLKNPLLLESILPGMI